VWELHVIKSGGDSPFHYLLFVFVQHALERQFNNVLCMKRLQTCRGRFNQHHSPDHAMEEVETRPSLIHIFQVGGEELDEEHGMASLLSVDVTETAAFTAHLCQLVGVPDMHLRHRRSMVPWISLAYAAARFNARVRR
jgi:hypothetical protein